MSNDSLTLNDYVERLLKEKDFSNLEPEVLDQLRTELGQRVEERINAVIIASLAESKLDEFNNLLDTHDQKKIDKFLHSNIVDLEALIAAELLKFRQTYLGVA